MAIVADGECGSGLLTELSVLLISFGSYSVLMNYLIDSSRKGMYEPGLKYYFFRVIVLLHR
jgi:hypothetical protein